MATASGARGAFATIYTGRDGKPAMRAFLADGLLVRYDMRIVEGKWIEKALRVTGNR